MANDPLAAGDVTQIFAASPTNFTTVGGLYWAPFGTELPEDVDTQLDPGFKPLGYISADGVSVKFDSSTTPIEAWGGDEIDTLRDKFSIEYSCKLYQVLSPDVQRAVWGDDAVSTNPADAQNGNRMQVNIGSKLPERCSLVLDAFYGDKMIRQVAQIARRSELADLTLVHNDAMTLEPTFKVFKGTNGFDVVQYSDDGQVVTS